MKNLPELPDSGTLVNFASSFLAHFGAPRAHPPIDWVLASLQGKKKVAVILLDGLGYHIRRLHPKAAAPLIEREIGTIRSVNPATTVAATTAFLSARYPKENGWLGWTSAFKDGNYLSFTGKNADTDSFDGTSHELPPYESLAEQIRKAGHSAALLFPEVVSGPGAPRSFGEELSALRGLFDEGKEFVYAYWTEPDHQMHDHGVESPIVEEAIDRLVKGVVAFASSLKEGEAVYVIADHGLVDVDEVDLALHHDLVDLMSRGFSIEGRAAAFFVKPGKEGEFAALFAKYYPNIDLYSREEVLRGSFFGTGEASPLYDELIGDFLALPRGNELLIDTYHYPHGGGFKGHHAGQSKEETAIGVSFFAGGKKQ